VQEFLWASRLLRSEKGCRCQRETVFAHKNEAALHWQIPRHKRIRDAMKHGAWHKVAVRLREVFSATILVVGNFAHLIGSRGKFCAAIAVRLGAARALIEPEARG
jgi:hypothetical protein